MARSKPISRCLLRPLALALAFALASAPLAAANFSYHGELLDGAAPAAGRYDLRVRTFAQPDSKAALGAAIELPNVDVIDGSFAVELDLPESKIGDTWVEVSVRKSDSGDAFEVLGALQKLAKANTGCWALDGNTGLPAGSFLGNADPASTAPMVLRARNSAVGTFTPRGTAANYGDAASVALGSSANSATASGSTVAGGGSTRDSGSICATCRNAATAEFATVSGGISNTASAGASTISGGSQNVASGTAAAIGGGTGNIAQGFYSTIGGGDANDANGHASVVAGGDDGQATAEYATVGGGYQDRSHGEYSTVPGGAFNCAGGDFSFAAGNSAKVRSGNGVGDQPCFNVNTSGDSNGDEGTFVWSDAQDADFVSAGPNQFLIRSAGGVGVNTNKLGTATDLASAEIVIKNSSAGANADLILINATNRGYSMASEPGSNGEPGQFYITEVDARTSNVQFTPRLRINPDGSTAVLNGTVANISDARVKKNIDEIEKPLETLLALRGHTFEYVDPARWMNSPGTRIGFVAQEVREVLPQWIADVGEGYLGVQTSGFEALAVEAIRDLKTAADGRIAALERDNAALQTQSAALRAELERVLARLSNLEASRDP